MSDLMFIYKSPIKDFNSQPYVKIRHRDDRLAVSNRRGKERKTINYKKYFLSIYINSFYL